jgi:hypothetical protein
MFLRSLNPHHSFQFGQNMVRPMNKIQIQPFKPLVGAVKPLEDNARVLAKKTLERSKM